MNDFVARKLGEVVAFAETGLNTSERAQDALLRAMNQSDYDELTAVLKKQAEDVKVVATRANQLSTTETKASATTTKLRTMRDTYIGDEWNNTTEIYEWSSFFAGAAGAHWALVEGAADHMKDDELLQLAQQSRQFYGQWLKQIESYLQSAGNKRAAE